MSKKCKLVVRSDLAKLDGAVSLRSPRNAYVSFEVVLERAGKTAPLDIKFSSLKGPSRIPARECEAYVRAWPEVLIPAKEVASSTELEGEVWVDIFVPPDVKPGAYAGAVTVNGEEVPISLEVVKVKVPDKSTLTADYNNYADGLSRGFKSLMSDPGRFVNGRYFEMERKFFRLAHEHRGLFHLLGYGHSGKVVPTFAPELEGEGKNRRVRSWELFDQHFGPYLDGSAFKGTKRGEIPVPYLYLPINLDWPASYLKWGKKGYGTEFRQVLAEMKKHFVRKGWNRTYLELFFNHKKRYKYFPYDGDETRHMWDEKMLYIFKELAAGLFGSRRPRIIFRTDSSWAFGEHFDSELTKFIKLWVVNRRIHSWFPESVKEMKKRDCIVWIYGAIRDMDVHFNDVGTFMLDAFMRGVDGFTYWSVTQWKPNLFSRRTRRADWDVLIYPGEAFGIDAPLGGRRLKGMRNIMQLSELLFLLANRKGMPAARRLVNRITGYQQADWWSPKPAFVNDPPYTWTNAKLSDAGKNASRKPLAEDVFPRLYAAVLDALEK